MIAGLSHTLHEDRGLTPRSTAGEPEMLLKTKKRKKGKNLKKEKESSMQIVIFSAGTVDVHHCHHQLSASVKPYTTIPMPSDLPFSLPSLFFSSSLPVYSDVMSHAIPCDQLLHFTTPTSPRDKIRLKKPWLHLVTWSTQCSRSRLDFQRV